MQNPRSPSLRIHIIIHLMIVVTFRRRRTKIFLKRFFYSSPACCICPTFRLCFVSHLARLKKKKKKKKFCFVLFLIFSFCVLISARLKFILRKNAADGTMAVNENEYLYGGVSLNPCLCSQRNLESLDPMVTLQRHLWRGGDNASTYLWKSRQFQWSGGVYRWQFPNGSLQHQCYSLPG